MREPVAAMDYHSFRAHRPDAFPPSAYFTPADQSAFFPPLSKPVAEQAAGDAGLQAALRGQHLQARPRWSESLQPEEGLEDDPRVTLDSQSLWSEFYKRGTEMVITKSGR